MKAWQWNRARVRRAFSYACLALGLGQALWLGARPYLASARRFADEHGGLHSLEQVRALRWREAQPLASSALEPAPLRRTLSPDGRWCVYEARGAAGDLDLYLAELQADGSLARAEALHELNTAADDCDPAFGIGLPLELHFASSRPGGAGGFDLYVADFAQGSAGAPRAHDDLNSEADELDPAPLPERGGARRLVFASNRARAERPGAQDHDLYAWSEPDGAIEQPAGTAEQSESLRRLESLAELNGPFDEREPAALAGGTRLVYAVQRAGSDGGPAQHELALAYEEPAQGAWQWLAPRLLEELNTGADERAPLPLGAGFELEFARSSAAPGALEPAFETFRASAHELRALPPPWPGLLELLGALLLIAIGLCGLWLQRLGAAHPLTRFLIASWIAHLLLLLWLRSVELAGAAPLERGSDAPIEIELEALPGEGEPYPLEARAPSEPSAAHAQAELDSLSALPAPARAAAHDWRAALAAGEAALSAPMRSEAPANPSATNEAEVAVRTPRSDPALPAVESASAQAALAPLASAPKSASAARASFAVPSEPAELAPALSAVIEAPAPPSTLAQTLRELEERTPRAPAPERASASFDLPSAREPAEPALALRAERAAPPTAPGEEPHALERALATPLARAPEAGAAPAAPSSARVPALAEPESAAPTAALAELAPREPERIAGLEQLERSSSAQRAPEAPERELLSPYRARSGPERAIALRQGGGGAQTERAVAAGLRYLARMQRAGGHWGDERALDAKYGRTVVGKTGLCLLAFLGAGHLPGGESEHAATAARALAALLAWQSPTDGHFGESEAYGHGIATLALAECYALGRDERLRVPLERAIARIVAAQDASGDPRRDGGFGYYGREGAADDGWPRSAISAWQTMALASARLAGIEGLDAPLERARAFLLRARGNDGVYRYNHDPRRLASAYPTLPASTPAALFALALAGEDLGRAEHARALDYVLQRAPSAYERASEADFVARAAGHPYFWYAGTLALFRAGGERWSAWNSALQRCLLPAQAEDGSWEPIDAYARYAGDGADDRSYTTALCVLTLEVYYRYLTPVLRAP
jgi:hypothetical protein